MASSTSTTTPIKHAFGSLCGRAKCPKDDLNSLILDYLTTEGYHSAASKFAKEANLEPQQPAQEVQSRQKIKEAIHNGKIEEAINRINESDYRVLEDDDALHFALLRLQLVELIRNSGNNPGPCIEFAKKHLAPRAPVRTEFLEDLERAMALLIFPHDNLEPDLAYLLQEKFRRDIADMVNKALIKSRYRRDEAAVHGLVRLRGWSEKAARNSKKDIPDSIEIHINGEDNDEIDTNMSQTNGHDPMDT